MEDLLKRGAAHELGSHSSICLLRLSQLLAQHLDSASKWERRYSLISSVSPVAQATYLTCLRKRSREALRKIS